MKNKRRKFLKKASLASIGLLTVNETLYGSPNKLSAKSYSKVIGANDRINIAFQGLGRRLPGLLKSSVKLNNVDILYFCDVMKKQIISKKSRLPTHPLNFLTPVLWPRDIRSCYAVL
mgnify:CR=1 FL=1